MGFSRGRSGGLVFPSLSEFSTVYCDPHKGFGIVIKAEIDVFLELSCFFNDLADVGNLISGFSAFSKTSLNIWKFTVHVLPKPGLENFEHYFTSTWDECSCAVVYETNIAYCIFFYERTQTTGKTLKIFSSVLAKTKWGSSFGSLRLEIFIWLDTCVLFSLSTFRKLHLSLLFVPVWGK